MLYRRVARGWPLVAQPRRGAGVADNAGGSEAPPPPPSQEVANNAGGERLIVSHRSEEDYASGGLRSFFAYRDLGIREATRGKVGAHVIKALRPVDRGQGSGAHSHDLRFQMVYVLKGRVKFWYEGEGEVELVEGSSVYQPSGIAHEIIEGSHDLEMLEITLPADFTTTEQPRTTAPQGEGDCES